jgi:hypothetical protein
MSGISWFIDECLFFRGTLFISGWFFHPIYAVSYLYYQTTGSEPVEIDSFHYGQVSLDVSAAFPHVSKSKTEQCRFQLKLPISSAEQALSTYLIVKLETEEFVVLRNLVSPAMDGDSYHQLQSRFFSKMRVKSKIQPLKVLEIGSRNRSGNIRRSLLGECVEYVGMDIIQGENVDIVGDAHDLSSIFPPNSFDAIFSMSVFEHLLMPWKVALELNKLLKPGGYAMITTHHTFPLHEMPWDFWRFSDQSWHSLFNSATGFRVIETALGERASIVAHLLHPVTLELDKQPAFLGSSVLVEKVSETSLTWDVKLNDVIQTAYPE